MSFISKFTKRDLGFAILTGVITGTIAWRVLEFLNVKPIHLGKLLYCINYGYSNIPSETVGSGCFYQYTMPWASLILIVPIVWILGVMLGYFLGQKLDFFNQFGKFAAIGFTNAAVDFGVLNFGLSITGLYAGLGFAGLKTVSFLVATLSSYVWNKYWAFKSNNSSDGRGGAIQLAKFFIVTLISFGINVGIASLVVNAVQPGIFGSYPFGLDAHQWANVGAIAGSATALVFSFIGFKLAVFKN